MIGGSTVYDRMKTNGGYMTGPRHRMQAGMEAVAAPESEVDGAAGPPNLRDAGESPDSCGQCVHFEPGDMGDKGSSACKLHGDHPVSANQVCDDFEGSPEGEEEGGMPEEMGGEIPMPMPPLRR